MASARRVASLLVSLDHLDMAARPESAIRRAEYDGSGLRLRDLSVTLDDGTVVIKDADVVIEPGERVLVRGESGTGKSTLVRAVAGLWPWGRGEIHIPRGATLFLMPQEPYVPLGQLRRVATYPLGAEKISNESLRELFDLVGLAHLSGRLDEEAPWEHVLSGGEKQRIAFVRLLLHGADFIVMDEATSALDPSSQERMLALVSERLPRAAIISIAHRPELEAFHQRVIVFEHQPGGSRMVSDLVITHPNRMVTRLLSWLQRGRAA
jgi:putative ATP-binding cassette transporter